MPTINKDIKKKPDELSDNEKLSVLNYLIQELDRSNPEIDKAWAKESPSVRRSPFASHAFLLEKALN